METVFLACEFIFAACEYKFVTCVYIFAACEYSFLPAGKKKNAAGNGKKRALNALWLRPGRTGRAVAAYHRIKEGRTADSRPERETRLPGAGFGCPD